MQNIFIYKTRQTLIVIGKQLPFIVCFIVLISYAECLHSLYTKDFVYYHGFFVLNKTLSWQFGTYFEYNAVSLAILTIISYALETCLWNKLAIDYLALQLLEKNYFLTIELNEQTLYAIIITNIAVSALLTTKGMIISWKK